MDIGIKFHGNPSNSVWDISLWQNNIAIYRVVMLTWLRMITNTKQIKCFPPRLMPLMSARVGMHAQICVIGYKSTCCRYPVADTNMPIHTLNWWCWKLSQPSPGQLHHSWWWGNLLCSLSIEDSSLERLPASILITSLTEIRKSLFSTLPFSFSLCPVAFTSCCSLISTHIKPQHTWWDFQYSSQFQMAEMERSLCKSSTCYHRH